MSKPVAFYGLIAALAIAVPSAFSAHVASAYALAGGLYTVALAARIER